MSHSKITTFTLITVLGLSAILRAKAAPAPLSPGPNDGTIAYITARLLEETHYTQHPFDTEISKRFYDCYLDVYDPEHVYFLQSDLNDFSWYRTNLDTLTLGPHGQADVTPAYKIFNRFKERLQQRVAYVDELLKHDDFKFTGDEQVRINRKDAPYPKNLDDAKRLWRQQLLLDFLRQKLDDENAPGTALSATDRVDIAQTLERRYDRELRQFDELESSDVLQEYLDSLAHAYDPHSDYMNNENAQNFSINMSLALFGIGAELTSDDGYCEIESLVPGGPAWKSNQLKPNDKIVAVAQGNQPFVDVVDMELSKIVQLIRGPKGTQVRLSIIPGDAPKSRRVVSLVRDEINIKDQQAKALLIQTPDGNGGTNRIGVIDVPSFYAPVDSSGDSPEIGNHVSVDVLKLVQKLKDEKAGGIILDLRGNPGGSLEEAIQFVGIFVTNGPVVQIRSPDNNDAEDENGRAPDIYHGPLIVLVNRLSASASEIVAAALQDYGRALIVGDTSTFGKGTVQNLDPLRPFVWAATDATNDPGLVKITIRKFYRINGASTQLKGVIPDIVLPDVLSYSQDIGENSLPNALPWDTIPATNYVALNDVQPYLPALLRDSAAQIATNQDFSYVRQDIAEVEKLQSENSDTLNERKAWDEKEMLEARKNKRDKEIALRPLPDITMYELTVANAEKPGLPAPVQLMKAPADSGDIYTAVFPTNSINVVPMTNSVPPDPMLEETEQIMRDYMSLERGGADTVASHE